MLEKIKNGIKKVVGLTVFGITCIIDKYPGACKVVAGGAAAFIFGRFIGKKVYNSGWNDAISYIALKNSVLKF